MHLGPRSSAGWRHGRAWWSAARRSPGSACRRSVRSPPRGRCLAGGRRRRPCSSPCVAPAPRRSGWSARPQDRGVDHGPLAALDGPRQEGQDHRGQPDGRPPGGGTGRPPRKNRGTAAETDPERVVSPGRELDRRVADQCGDRDQGLVPSELAIGAASRLPGSGSFGSIASTACQPRVQPTFRRPPRGAGSSGSALEAGESGARIGCRTELPASPTHRPTDYPIRTPHPWYHRCAARGTTGVRRSDGVPRRVPPSVDRPREAGLHSGGAACPTRPPAWSRSSIRGSPRPWTSVRVPRRRSADHHNPVRTAV